MRHAAEQTQFKFTFFKIVHLAIFIFPILGKIFTRSQFAQFKLIFIDPRLFTLPRRALREKSYGTQRAFVYQLPFEYRRDAGTSKRSRLAPEGQSADRLSQRLRGRHKAVLRAPARIYLFPGGMDRFGYRSKL